MNIIVIAETFLAFVIAVTLHEAAHAAMAFLLGDGSPWGEGRLSVNPRRQMAAIGTIVAVTLSFGVGGIPAGLGWGKPVEVDGRRMRVGQDVGMFLVALAGPTFSLFMGLLFSITLHFFPHYIGLSDAVDHCALGTTAVGSSLQACLSQAQPIWQLRVEQFLFLLAATNILLALANLIPLYPLDGYDMLFALLPNDPAVRFRDFRPYMEFTLLIIFFLVPYLLEIVRLPFLNPGYWLATWSVELASRVAGAVYPLFVYRL
jgi:Zn-dependent protease